MNNVLGISDFSDKIQKSFIGTELTIEQIEYQVVQNFEKGLISEEIFNNAFEVLDRLEKAKYLRREGGPGNYKYIYKESEVKGESGDKEESKADISSQGIRDFLGEGEVIGRNKIRITSSDFKARIEKFKEIQEKLDKRGLQVKTLNPFKGTKDLEFSVEPKSKWEAKVRQGGMVVNPAKTKSGIGTSEDVKAASRL